MTLRTIFLVAALTIFSVQTVWAAPPQDQPRLQQKQVQKSEAIKVVDLRAPSATVKRGKTLMSPVLPIKPAFPAPSLTVKQTVMSLQFEGVNVVPSNVYATFNADRLSVQGKGRILIAQPQYVFSGFINFNAKNNSDSFTNLYLEDSGVFVVDYTLGFVNEAQGTQAVCDIAANNGETVTTIMFKTTKDAQHLIVVINRPQATSSSVASSLNCYRNDGKGLRYSVNKIDVTRP
jgi:hypothetical protein